MDIIEKAWIELSKESLFFSILKMNFENIPSEKVKTMKVSISPKGIITLYYNPHKLENLGLIFTKALLKHEILHIIHGHIFLKAPEKRQKDILNLSMDAAINQYIPEIDALSVPMDVLLSEGHGADNEFIFVGPPFHLPNKTVEEYFKWALEYIEKLNKFDLELVETPDSHEDFGNFEMPQEFAMDIVSQVVTEAYEKSKGDIPSGVDIGIKVILKMSKTDWKTILRRFFGSSIFIEKQQTVFRPNRRYDDKPGWRSIHGPKLAFILDTSGSMIEEEYSEFFSELERIIKILNARVHLIQIDENIQSVTMYGREDWKEINLKGKGNTDLQPAVDYAQENIRPEGIIIFTDGYVDVPVVKRKVLFVLSSKSNPDFENEVKSLYGEESVISLRNLKSSKPI